METNPTFCPSCGNPIAPGADVCPVCGQNPTCAAPVSSAIADVSAAPIAPAGPPAPPPAENIYHQPPPAYGQPAASPLPQNPAGFYPAGYSQPPQQSPYQGYSPTPQPGNWNAPPAVYPTYGGGAGTPPPYFPLQPPPRRNNTGCIVASIIAGVIVVACVMFVLGFLVAEQSPSTQSISTYQDLVDTICDATAPQDIAYYQEDLANFAKLHPGTVEKELQTLMDTCVEYEDAPLEEARYTNAETALRHLVDSDSPTAVSSCADNVLSFVLQSHKNFQIEPLPTSMLDDGASPLEIVNFTIYQKDGKDYFDFTVKNNTESTITYFELWIFCYDSAGIVTRSDEYDDNLEWISSEECSIEPGQEYTEKGFNFHKYKDLAMAYPYVAYYEQEDGSNEGLTAPWITEELQAPLNKIAEFADEWAEDAATSSAAKDGWHANQLAMTMPQWNALGSSATVIPQRFYLEIASLFNTPAHTAA